METNRLQTIKPTAYLDQNILDLFVSYDRGSFYHELKQNYQIVYSDETLKEICRSGESANLFLNLLKDLDATYIKIFVEQPRFRITDKVTLSTSDPFLIYNEYLAL